MENRKPTENRRLRSMQSKTVDTDTVLGSGKVTAILGKGGFATVYEIWNPKLEIKRAVKLWHPDISQKALDRFETEIKITAKLHHPNIVEIHNVGEWNGLPYIEMEKIDGYCLKEILDKTGALPVDVALAICILICRALTYAHRQNYLLYGIQRKGIVHCDIKPANIMITQRGVVKLTDFGLATPTDETLHAEEDKVNGSIHYSSPEQLKTIQVDQRTDIYSLGVVMYELFAGQKAFFGKNLEELVYKRLNDTYEPFHEICRDINPAIKKIVKKCMAQDRDDRYTNAQELLVDIEKVFYKMSNETPERVIYHFFSNPKRNRKPTFRPAMISAIAIVLLLAIVSIGSYFFLKRSATVNITDIFSFMKKNEVTFSPDQSSEGTVKPTDSQKLVSKQKPRKPVQIIDSSKKAVRSSQKTSRIKSSSSTVQQQPASVQQIVTTEPRKTEPSTLSNESIFQQLRAAVQKNDRTKASYLFKTYKIDDGEYYFLYAQYLSNIGKWQDALSNVDKGFKTQSLRLTPEQHRLLYMSSKARCLTAAFDATGLKDNGDKAMEAWFDVKYILKGMPSNPEFEYADSEIRRINKVLQNGAEN